MELDISIDWVESPKDGNSLLVGLGANELGGQLDPGDLLGALGEGLVWSVVHQSHLLPGGDDLAESTESHGTSNKVLTVLETVVLLEDGRVSVGVADEVVGGGEVVGLGRCPASQLLRVGSYQLTSSPFRQPRRPFRP